MSTVSYLDRLLEPVTESFTPQLARMLVELRADDELQEEVEVLRQKANLGTLTEAENAAYQDFVEALDVLSIIQSSAPLPRQSSGMTCPRQRGILFADEPAIDVSTAIYPRRRHPSFRFTSSTSSPGNIGTKKSITPRGSLSPATAVTLLKVRICRASIRKPARKSASTILAPMSGRITLLSPEE
jgi:hypothetical protein